MYDKEKTKVDMIQEETYRDTAFISITMQQVTLSLDPLTYLDFGTSRLERSAYI